MRGIDASGKVGLYHHRRTDGEVQEKDILADMVQAHPGGYDRNCLQGRNKYEVYMLTGKYGRSEMNQAWIDSRRKKEALLTKLLPIADPGNGEQLLKEIKKHWEQVRPPQMNLEKLQRLMQSQVDVAEKLAWLKIWNGSSISKSVYGFPLKSIRGNASLDLWTSKQTFWWQLSREAGAKYTALKESKEPNQRHGGPNDRGLYRGVQDVRDVWSVFQRNARPKVQAWRYDMAQLSLAPTTPWISYPPPCAFQIHQVYPHQDNRLQKLPKLWASWSSSVNSSLYSPEHIKEWKRPHREGGGGTWTSGMEPVCQTKRMIFIRLVRRNAGYCRMRTNPGEKIHLLTRDEYLAAEDVSRLINVSLKMEKGKGKK